VKVWTVTAAVFGGHHLGEFEAETGDEAIAMAVRGAGVSLCHECSRDISDPQLERFVAECGDEVFEDEPSRTWEDQARAAGWRPPAKKRAKAGGGR